MLVFVAIVHIYFYFLFLYSLQGKERPAQTNLMPAKLRAVLATFGFSENIICRLRAVLACAVSDSAQC